jgi:hypothetical protein
MIVTMKLPENVKAYFQRQGRIGAARREEVVSPERRSEIARLAAQARWAKPAAKATNKTETK